MIVFCKVFSETKAEVMLCPVVGKINADNTEPQVTYNTLCAFRKTHFTFFHNITKKLHHREHV